ncbi:hypothetical protein [Candidatus Laterigemmans baculatus]|uniref:hypothetical protein n=1 Tax=Candidatus Laterigemmans baculatus TaxID=2770505 RepID=UPI0013DCAC9C|nr:hypothetical protein [Candidatus Laterigemmans baculatus]
MRLIHTFAASAFIAACTLSGGSVVGDSVRLTNGDTIVGKVISLNGKELVIDSENFGEVKIPREKVGVIGLGDKPLSEALGAADRVPPPVSSELPSLQSPMVREQIDRLLQQSLGGGFGNARQQMEQSRQGLKELQKDLGPGSSADALDGYIKMLEMFGAGAAPAPANQRPQTQTPENQESAEEAAEPSAP